MVLLRLGRMTRGQNEDNVLILLTVGEGVAVAISMEAVCVLNVVHCWCKGRAGHRYIPVCLCHLLPGCVLEYRLEQPEHTLVQFASLLR
jgi:hypothetical protein